MRMRAAGVLVLAGCVGLGGVACKKKEAAAPTDNKPSATNPVHAPPVTPPPAIKPVEPAPKVTITPAAPPTTTAPTTTGVTPAPTPAPTMPKEAPPVTLRVDPRLLTAEGEARAKFPQFVEAYGKAQDKASFAVQTAFTAKNGMREKMWVRVTGLVGTTVSGTLEGNPVLDIGHKAGDRLTIALENITDWTYSESGQSHGLFTVPVQKMIDEEQGSNK